MYCHRQNKIRQSIITVTAVGRYTPGEKLQEQVAGTRRNTSQRQITSRLENFCENKCVSAKEFCCSNMLQKKEIRQNLCDLLWDKILLQQTNNFLKKNSPVQKKRFVAMMCCCN